jgi:spore germination protein KC
MIKKIFLAVLIIILFPALLGCWDYTGLNQMNIVLGVAVDKDILTGEYKVTYEVVDTTKAGKDEVKSVLYDTKGISIFDSARNAKQMLANKLYFGNIAVIVVSHQIAEKEKGIEEVIDLFVRGAEARETIEIAVSQESTAAEILRASPLNINFISTKLSEILQEDKKTTAKTYSIQLIRVSEILTQDGRELVLPAVMCRTNEGIPAIQTNGIAAFKKGRLIGYLTPDETKYFLYIMNEIKGGLLVFKTKEDIAVTMEIYQNSTKKSIEYQDGVFKVLIEPKTRVFIGELSGRVDMLNKAVKERVQSDAAEFVKQNITNVIQKAQNVLGSDIFGFGGMVYRKDPKLWSKVKRDWDIYFKSIEFEIKPAIEIVNTELLTH